jgi:hypothetical protein
MTRSLTITTNTPKPSKVIARAARFAPLLILTGHVLLDLERELGSWEAAGRYLLKVAENVGKPLAVNAPTCRGLDWPAVSPHQTMTRSGSMRTGDT